MTGGRYAWAVTALTVAFAARVAGQALQRWAPVSFLPPFDDFQGSGLPYPALLAAQIVILAVALAVIARMHGNKGLVGARLIMPVAVLGALYFTVMAVRLVLGLSVLSHSEWFSTWIPTVFHLVLAAKLLLISAYQRQHPMRARK